MKLSERDSEIAETLSHRIRFFSVYQIARHWWQDEVSEEDRFRLALRRLQSLSRSDFLIRKWVSIPPELCLVEPEFKWSPGEPSPDYGKLSWRVRKRWSGQAESTEIYQIGKAGLRQFGGRAGGPKKLSHIKHDLHVGTVYLALLSQDSSVKNRWISEDELAPERVKQKLPDALLRAYKGQREKVIEFGGAYSAEHIQSFHEDCESRGLSYEFW